MTGYVMTNGNGPLDTTPTSGSKRPVTSDGIYTALAGKQDTLSVQNITGFTVASGTTFPSPFSSVKRYGNMITINFGGATFPNSGGSSNTYLSGIPTVNGTALGIIYSDSGSGIAIGYVIANGTTLNYATRSAGTANALGQIIYFTTDP